MELKKPNENTESPKGQPVEGSAILTGPAADWKAGAALAMAEAEAFTAGYAETKALANAAIAEQMAKVRRNANAVAEADLAEIKAEAAKSQVNFSENLAVVFDKLIIR